MRRFSKFIVSIVGELPYLIYLDIRSTYYPSRAQLADKVINNELLTSRIAFYSALIKQGELYFDVGANIGNRISPLLRVGARVVAVEPQKSLARFLRYKFGNQIQIVAKGIDSEKGIKTLYLADASTISSFSISLRRNAHASSPIAPESNP